MEQSIGEQLGGLLLGAVPTVILLLTLYALYQLLVHRPLQRVLVQRRALTEGAMEQAQAGIAAAENKAREYEQKLRAARQSLFRSLEAELQNARLVREQALDEARLRAEEQLQKARGELQQQVAEAKAKLTADAGQLASRIAATVTASGRAGGVSAGQAS
jgi:F-type H+-transporting ATPase subunit b